MSDGANASRFASIIDKRKGSGKVNLSKLLEHAGLMQKWKMQVNSQVAASCGFPAEGMDWAMDVDDKDAELDVSNDSFPFPIADLVLRDACLKVLDCDL